MMITVHIDSYFHDVSQKWSHRVIIIRNLLWATALFRCNQKMITHAYVIFLH